MELFITAAVISSNPANVAYFSCIEMLISVYTYRCTHTIELGYIYLGKPQIVCFYLHHSLYAYMHPHVSLIDPVWTM
jgi:hypothetical protein